MKRIATCLLLALLSPLAAMAAPDLVLTKDDGIGAVNAGETITYILEISNDGTDATGVVLTDTLPSHTTFDPLGSSPGWSCAAATCTLSVPLLSAGSAYFTTLAVVVDFPLAAGVIHISNTASVADDGTGGPDLNPSDNTASELTPIGAGTFPDLAIAKSDGGATALAGDTVTYILSAANVGNQDGDGVRLFETVPAHSTFNSAASDPSWICAGSAPGSACTLDIPLLNALALALDFSFAVDVDLPLAAGANLLTNDARIDFATSTGTIDRNPTNNDATDTTPLLAAPDLVVVKDDGGISVSAGELYSYTITVSNTGTQDASGVELSETVPSDTSFDAAASSPGWS